MRAIIQRVKQSAVTVDKEIVGQIGPGLMVLIPNREWIGAAGFRKPDDAIEHLFRSEPPILWQRDGY